jgi:hypothetical protein
MDHTYSNMNQESLLSALPEAMQFGWALDHILFTIHQANPNHRPVYTAKWDVNNGYSHMHLWPNRASCLAYLLPKFDGKEQLVAIPLIPTMGWVESPLVFCMLSKTITNLSNECMHDPTYTTKAHCLEPLAKERDK